MEAKLTLKLNKKVIEAAKQYAAIHNKSLSRLFEAYLQTLTESEPPQSNPDADISPYVKSLKTGVHIPADLNYKAEFGHYLKEKYK